MNTITLETIQNEINGLIADIEMIKCVLFSHRPGPDPEGELSDWAIKELEEARKTPDSELISMEEIERELLATK